MLMLAGYLLFVRTTWGQAFDYTGYFGHVSVARTLVRVNDWFLGQVGVRSLVVASALLLGIALLRRRMLFGVMALFGIAVAVEGAEFLKHELPRPELTAPASRVPNSFHKDSYPSGHTTFAASIALAFLLVSSARWRPWLAAPVGAICAFFATGVIFVGGHRPSDPVGALLWSTLCLGLAALVAIRFSGGGTPRRLNRRALLLSGCLVLPSILALWYSTGWLGAKVAETNWPLISMLTVIVLASYSQAAWLAWVLPDDRAITEDPVEPPAIAAT